MMLIRRAGIDDVEQLRLLYQELEEDGVRYQPEHFVVGERSNEFFQSVFESADQDILVAEEDGKILGFSHVMILEQKKVACLKPETLVYIQDLDVLESRRSQGIGTLLMEASKRYGKEHGVDFIRTQVFPQNIDGMRFYEKNGFREMMKTIESSLD
ncbi:GNAT family N-acetyltransferase [Sellimonas intestinalis]|uniref:GNAT family N-acetyltransferase n=2 Tax=Sellimonas intestinalis TaxID=1653434 RepID=A0A3E3JZY1_9FIRM|nr:GNAT family N-acetyltransferase [Sellimonas intestinalis]PWM92583.1 MAG: N-acetyltransferase [Ruminococcus sp.]MTS24350.1 GNAT family N-acetyltransferase [Sellimonas intestinalis]NSJ22806.1 GNAT family N-acetyltransferase [Sellimonas intestinalis]NSK62030.1 GNAT family N-acetyltransferase [Sellimonas intestinalis]RGD36978.1 GNAT family N-acetyltransferase [Sellimonas intestinalis]